MYSPRTLSKTTASGVVLGAVAIFLAVAVGTPVRDANSIVFPLGALVFGFGLTSWASALLYGGALDRVATLGDMSEDWSSEKIADAMSVLTVFGAGVMVGGVVATELLAALS